MLEQPFFTTERLVFRPFEAADLDALAALTADAEVMRFVGEGSPLSRETTSLWIERSRENVARFGYGTGALAERASSELIGWAGWARPEGEPEEIVYGFARSAWGVGLGTEIVRGLVDYAFGSLGLAEIRATVAPGNAASERILLGQGFVLTSWAHDAEARLFLRRPDGAVGHHEA